MSRLSDLFATLRACDEKALITFITAGDPNAERTVEIVVTLAAAGADAVEIGIPFSDPLADGPSIQASSQRALHEGMTVRKALHAVQRIRELCPNLPIILMTYYNPILRYGLENYAADAKLAGVDAHIVTDLTPEEAAPWNLYSHKEGLDAIYLLAPTSTEERIQKAANISGGFIYCVSRTGVTGAREDIPRELPDVVSRIRKATDLPICVGFGVSEPEHIRAISNFADGVVVGSALVNLIHREKDSENLLVQVREYISGLKAATR